MIRRRFKIDIEKFKNPIFYTACIATFSFFLLYLFSSIGEFFLMMFPKPEVYVFKLFFSDLYLFFFFILLLLGILLVIKKRKSDMTYTEIYKQKGFMGKVILFSFIGWFCMDALIIPGGVIINFHETNKLSFEYSLIKDIYQDNVTIAEVSSDKIKVDDYTDKLDQVGGYCVMYMQDDKDLDRYKYSSVEYKDVKSIIESLKEYEKKITIEFYSNTGVIKKIDGIEKWNIDNLKERVKKLKEKQFEHSLSNGQKQRLILEKMLYWLNDGIDVMVFVISSIVLTKNWGNDIIIKKYISHTGDKIYE